MKKIVKISGKPDFSVVSDQSDSISDWFKSEFQMNDVPQDLDEPSSPSDKDAIIMN